MTLVLPCGLGAVWASCMRRKRNAERNCGVCIVCWSADYVEAWRAAWARLAGRCGKTIIREHTNSNTNTNTTTNTNSNTNTNTNTNTNKQKRTINQCRKQKHERTTCNLVTIQSNLINRSKSTKSEAIKDDNARNTNMNAKQTLAVHYKGIIPKKKK